MSPKPAHTIVPVSLDSRSYDILIGTGLLEQADTWKSLPPAAAAVVVTNDTVGPLYAQVVRSQLEKHYASVSTVVLPDGEQFKTWASLDMIFDHLLRNGCDRKTVLVALGGGVVGDITGFAAASYMRGVPFVQVPTTLLSQVDSSVGGKTAINHPLGKNMIGAFYQPLRVVADLDTLKSLPDRELSAGLAEVIKYGPIADAAFFDWIEANLGALLSREPLALTTAIRRSCEIKASVVGQDERESGIRAILNFGHTFGHAIEAGLGYGQWLHGEAVGAGMAMAASLSVALGLIEPRIRDRIVDVVAKAGLPVTGPDLPVERYLEIMRLDKKAESGEIKFVVLSSMGEAKVQSVDDRLVADVIRAHTR